MFFSKCLVAAVALLSQTVSVAAAPIAPRAANGKLNMAYYGAWSRFSTTNQFEPLDLNVRSMTHVIYAFATIDTNGEVIPADEWADFRGSNGDLEPVAGPDDAAGNIQQLYILKKYNRSLKTLLSVGGYTYSHLFKHAVKDAASRKRFATSAVKMMADYGMDGIDIDWEYPESSAEGEQFLLLLQDTRKALDDYAKEVGDGYRYQLTIATPAGTRNIQMIPLTRIDPVVDTVHLMAYDYAGSWSANSGHASNIMPDTANPGSTTLSTTDVVDTYLRRGITASKLLLGIPLYGRTFANTAGLGKSTSGAGSSTPGEDAGVRLYKDLPRSGSTTKNLSKPMATFSYDSSRRELTSWDNQSSTRQKVSWLNSLGLGGSFFWKADGDKLGSNSLIKIAADNLGGMDSTRNQMNYPNSRFENIRRKMPGSSRPPTAG